MKARISWLIFHFVGVAAGLYALMNILNQPKVNHVLVIVLIAVFLVLSLLSTWRSLAAVIRYARYPLQTAQHYKITGQPLEQFLIAPILVEGPCLLVLKSDLEMVSVAIGHMHAAKLSPFRASAYSFGGRDFRIRPGKWPLKLVIQLPGHFFRSFRLGLRHQGKSFNASLSLEARGRSSFVKLPDNIQEITRAFPILEGPPGAHHL